MDDLVGHFGESSLVFGERKVLGKDPLKTPENEFTVTLNERPSIGTDHSFGQDQREVGAAPAAVGWVVEQAEL